VGLWINYSHSAYFVVFPVYMLFSTQKISLRKINTSKGGSFILILPLLLFFMQSTFGQTDTTKVNSLEDALKIGMQNNLLLKSADYEIQKQQYARKSALDFEKTSVDFEYGQLNTVVKNDNSLP
jgi:cobalt-zinc-cadmium resistance protein CzcA